MEEIKRNHNMKEGLSIEAKEDMSLALPSSS